jgi:TolA-binding protein
MSIHRGTGTQGKALLLAFLLLIGEAGCSYVNKVIPRAWQQDSQQHKQQRKTNPTVNPKAQKHYYDQGLQLYSKESYKEAKEAFETVVDNGPNTALGLKAQENITKIDQVLKTLEDIEAK